MWYPEPLHGIRTIAARKIASRLGLGFGLGLVLEIGLGGAIFLGGNCPRTFYISNLNINSFVATSKRTRKFRPQNVIYT